MADGFFFDVSLSLNCTDLYTVYTVYPDHTATSYPGLSNFLFYFFN